MVPTVIAAPFDWAGLALTVVATVASVATMYGIMKTQLAQVRERQAVLDANAAACSTERAAITTNLAEVRGRLDRAERDVVEAKNKADGVSEKLGMLMHLPEQVKELGAKLDRLLERSEPRNERSSAQR